MLSGPTYLGDISKVYLRLCAGIKYEVKELRGLFKEVTGMRIEEPGALSYIPLEAT
jgi:hypothetical protein